jgi:hypothetical protein
MRLNNTSTCDKMTYRYAILYKLISVRKIAEKLVLPVPFDAWLENCALAAAPQIARKLPRIQMRASCRDSNCALVAATQNAAHYIAR